MPKEIDFSNEDEIVGLLLYLSSGIHYAIKIKLKLGREALDRWKKFYLYWGADIEKRRDLEVPWSIYHFMDGHGHAAGSILLGSVQAMQIIPVNDDDEKWRG